MAEAAAASGNAKLPAVDTGKLAWGILIISFIAFCVLCIFTVVGLNNFLFQSTVPMQTIVRVARGTVTWTDATLIPQAAQRSVELYNSAVISTDVQSQATMFVYDQYYQDRLVAAITIKGDSTLDLDQVMRPRFEWSSQQYLLVFQQVQGEFDITIPENLGRDVWVSFETPQGARARMIQSGRYTIRASGSQIQVSNRSGEALIALADEAHQPVPQGQRMTMFFADNLTTMQPTLANLLGADTFSANNILDVNDGTRPRELVWGCNNVQNDFPAGFFGLTQLDGFTALRLGRGGGASSHGETICSQYFPGASGQQGLDVSEYTYLSVRVTFKIMGHSLSTCGTEASECPLMLRMDYIPAEGAPTEWIHGFFSFTNPDSGYPLRCPSCTIDHEIVNQNAWFTFDSGNLISSPADPRRPRSILNFRFYASGHEYDVYVSEIALLAGQSPSAAAG